MKFEEYILLNNPTGVKKVLEDLGAPAIKDKETLIRALAYAVSDNKLADKTYSKLAQIETPYRSLILTEAEKNSDCKCKSNFNTELDNQWVQPQTVIQEPKHNHLMVASLVLLGVITIAVMVKK